MYGASGPVRTYRTAVCTLTDRTLAAALAVDSRVAIAGPLMTANLGIERLIRAVVAPPPIDTLLLCGRDSPLFRPGQSLMALVRNGIRVSDRRILGAVGHDPFLPNITIEDVERFRHDVTVIDERECEDVDRLRQVIALCCPAPAESSRPLLREPDVGFVQLRPGGRRRPIVETGGGFFVVEVDTENRCILVHHYHRDLRPRHRMSGVRAESMVLGLIDAGVVNDLSHAAYLGAELTKAETALRLGLPYAQDLPLRPTPAPAPPF